MKKIIFENQQGFFINLEEKAKLDTVLQKLIEGDYNDYAKKS